MPREAHAGFGTLAREHLARPRNLGSIEAAAGGVIVSGEAGSENSGSLVRFHLRLVAGRIAEARYEVLGEPALIAAASYLSELVTGRRADPGAQPRGLELAQALGLPRSEHGAALLAEDAVRAALQHAPTASGR